MADDIEELRRHAAEARAEYMQPVPSTPSAIQYSAPVQQPNVLREQSEQQMIAATSASMGIPAPQPGESYVTTEIGGRTVYLPESQMTPFQQARLGEVLTKQQRLISEGKTSEASKVGVQIAGTMFSGYETYNPQPKIDTSKGVLYSPSGAYAGGFISQEQLEQYEKSGTSRVFLPQEAISAGRILEQSYGQRYEKALDLGLISPTVTQRMSKFEALAAIGQHDYGVAVKRAEQPSSYVTQYAFEKSFLGLPIQAGAEALSALSLDVQSWKKGGGFTFDTVKKMRSDWREQRIAMEYNIAGSFGTPEKNLERELSGVSYPMRGRYPGTVRPAQLDYLGGKVVEKFVAEPAGVVALQGMDIFPAVKPAASLLFAAAGTKTALEGLPGALTDYKERAKFIIGAGTAVIGAAGFVEEMRIQTDPLYGITTEVRDIRMKQAKETYYSEKTRTGATTRPAQTEEAVEVDIFRHGRYVGTAEFEATGTYQGTFKLTEGSDSALDRILTPKGAKMFRQAKGYGSELGISSAEEYGVLELKVKPEEVQIVVEPDATLSERTIDALIKQFSGRQTYVVGAMADTASLAKEMGYVEFSGQPGSRVTTTKFVGASDVLAEVRSSKGGVGIGTSDALSTGVSEDIPGTIAIMRKPVLAGLTDTAAIYEIPSPYAKTRVTVKYGGVSRGDASVSDFVGKVGILEEGIGGDFEALAGGKFSVLKGKTASPALIGALQEAIGGSIKQASERAAMADIKIVGPVSASAGLAEIAELGIVRGSESLAIPSASRAPVVSQQAYPSSIANLIFDTGVSGRGTDIAVSSARPETMFGGAVAGIINMPSEADFSQVGKMKPPGKAPKPAEFEALVSPRVVRMEARERAQQKLFGKVAYAKQKSEEAQFEKSISSISGQSLTSGQMKEYKQKKNTAMAAASLTFQELVSGPEEDYRRRTIGMQQPGTRVANELDQFLGSQMANKMIYGMRTPSYGKVVPVTPIAPIPIDIVPRRERTSLLSGFGFRFNDITGLKQRGRAKKGGYSERTHTGDIMELVSGKRGRGKKGKLDLRGII